MTTGRWSESWLWSSSPPATRWLRVPPVRATLPRPSSGATIATCSPAGSGRAGGLRSLRRPAHNQGTSRLLTGSSGPDRTVQAVLRSPARCGYATGRRTGRNSTRSGTSSRSKTRSGVAAAPHSQVGREPVVFASRSWRISITKIHGSLQLSLRLDRGADRNLTSLSQGRPQREQQPAALLPGSTHGSTSLLGKVAVWLPRKGSVGRRWRSRDSGAHRCAYGLSEQKLVCPGRAVVGWLWDGVGSLRTLRCCRLRPLPFSANRSRPSRRRRSSRLAPRQQAVDTSGSSPAESSGRRSPPNLDGSPRPSP